MGAVHGVHAVAPVVELNVPTGHRVHCTSAKSELCDPTLQPRGSIPTVGICVIVRKKSCPPNSSKVGVAVLVFCKSPFPIGGANGVDHNARSSITSISWSAECWMWKATKGHVIMGIVTLAG